MKRWNCMQLGLGLLLGVGLLFCQVAAVLAAEPTPFSVSIGYDFASGDYGTGQKTESSQIPVTIWYAPNERLDLELALHFIYQSNGSTINMGGIWFPRHDSGTGGGGMGGGGMYPTDPQSGLGDTTLTAGYILLNETENAPMFRPLAYVKLPTGNANLGLGSGAYDFGGGLSLAKGFGPWFTYAETLYIVPGTTATFNPDNYWTYLVSANYAMTESLTCGIDLSGATAVVSGSSGALYLELNTNYAVSEQGSIGGYVSKGLSSGSADYIVGVYGAVNF